MIKLVSTLIYDTRGRFERAPELCVVMVSTVNKAKDTRPGTHVQSSQKLTQDKITMRILGM